MDDLRVGAACRAMRHRLGWRQVGLAAKAGCNQTTISRLERGFAASLSIATVRRVFAALGAGFDGIVTWRGGELDRLLDERHAELVELSARTYRSRGWTVIPEVTFSRYGERGSIDLLAVHEQLKAVAVNEMKTRIVSIEETIRRHDAKVRLAVQIVFDRFGWRPSVVGRVLILPEGMTSRRAIQRHDAVFRAAYPQASREALRWLREPRGAMAAIWFLSPRRPEAGREVRPGRNRVRVRRASTEERAASARRLQLPPNSSPAPI